MASKNNLRLSTWKSWYRMIDRCYNSNNPRYKDWGGRGIAVCPRWLHSFENFLGNMGLRPKGKSLDRKNNEGDYTPRNCKWSTPKQQANNRRLFLGIRRQSRARGTMFDKGERNKPWRARICTRGSHKNLGSFLTEEEAHNAYLEARKVFNK